MDGGAPRYSLRGPLPLARAGVDRAGHRRSDDEWLEATWKDPRSRAFVVADGLVAVDDKTIAYLKGRPLAPTGVEWDHAAAYWKTLHSDADAKFDSVVELDATQIIPQVTWGTSPEMVLGVDARVQFADAGQVSLATQPVQQAQMRIMAFQT